MPPKKKATASEKLSVSQRVWERYKILRKNQAYPVLKEASIDELVRDILNTVISSENEGRTFRLAAEFVPVIVTIIQHFIITWSETAYLFLLSENRGEKQRKTLIEKDFTSALKAWSLSPARPDLFQGWSGLGQLPELPKKKSKTSVVPKIASKKPRASKKPTASKKTTKLTVLDLNKPSDVGDIKARQNAAKKIMNFYEKQRWKNNQYDVIDPSTLSADKGSAAERKRWEKRWEKNKLKLLQQVESRLGGKARSGGDSQWFDDQQGLPAAIIKALIQVGAKNPNIRVSGNTSFEDLSLSKRAAARGDQFGVYNFVRETTRRFLIVLFRRAVYYTLKRFSSKDQSVEHTITVLDMVHALQQASADQITSIIKRVYQVEEEKPKPAKKKTAAKKKAESQIAE